MPSTTDNPGSAQNAPSARRVDGPRRELKIAIDGEDLPWARSLVRLHPAGFQKTHPGRWIDNVYFDSPSLRNYEDNVAGIANRRKLRLRWYGELQGGSTPVLELKLRKNGWGWKVRYSIDALEHVAGRSWGDILDLLTESMEPRDRPAIEEDHVPILVNRYYREYYRSAWGECDLTVDTGYRFFDQRFASLPNLSHPVPLARGMVIELKFPAGGEQAVREIAARFPFRLTKSSKYVIGVQACFAASG